MIYQTKEFVLKNGIKVVFKTPEISDAKGLLDAIIRVSATTDFITSLPEDYQLYLDDMSKEEAFIRNIRESADSYMLAVYVNDAIVGSCALNFFKNIKQRHRGTIGIALVPEYQSMGIGSLLFDEIINIAKNREDVTQLELGVMKDNSQAKRLYTSKGFVKIGDTPRALRLTNGTYLDEEMMILYLDK